MEFEYSIKGKVDKNFCFRGKIFSIGEKFNIYINKNELDFIKSHSIDFEIKSLIEPPEPIPNKPKEVKNGQRGNKRKSKKNL